MRRRTLLAGAAWSVPVIAVGAPALAAAASQTPTNRVCSVAYYDGNNDYQHLRLTLAASLETGTIPSGTTLYWRVTVSGGTNTGAPVLEASSNWTSTSVTLTETSGTSKTWTVAATTTTDLAAGDIPCDLTLSWMGSTAQADGYLVGGSTLTVSNFGTVEPSSTGAYIGQLSFTVAERRTIDLGADGYTEEELKSVSAHVYSTSSNTPVWPPVYWDPSGVADTSSAAGWTNAKYGIANNGAGLTLPQSTTTIGGTLFAVS